FQAEDGIRDFHVTGVQTCALPIFGGGIVKVPVLNAWCGVPIRAAAATSALMLGITVVASAIPYYLKGYLVPQYAAATVLGVLARSEERRVGEGWGARDGPRSRDSR